MNPEKSNCSMGLQGLGAAENHVRILLTKNTLCVLSRSPDLSQFCP